MSESGWMETPHFLEWFSNVFLKHTNAIEGPKILIFDGHLSHISLETVEKAVENKNVNLKFREEVQHTE